MRIMLFDPNRESPLEWTIVFQIYNHIFVLHKIIVNNYYPSKNDLLQEIKYYHFNIRL